MKKLNVDLYTIRKEMQEKGVTHPSEEFKTFTRDFVEKLQTYPLDEENSLLTVTLFDTF